MHLRPVVILRVSFIITGLVVLFLSGAWALEEWI